MASQISRLYDFTAGTKAKSGEVDAEFNQIVAAHNVSAGEIETLKTDVDALEAQGAVTSDTIVSIRINGDGKLEVSLDGVAWSEANPEGNLTLSEHSHGNILNDGTMTKTQTGNSLIGTDADGAVVNFSDVDATAVLVALLTEVLALKATLSGGKVLPEQRSAPIVSVTVSRALALTDAGADLVCSNSSAAVLTVPANATVAFPIGTEIEICRASTSTVTVEAASGVTFTSEATSYTILTQHTSIFLKKLATDSWNIQGNVG